MPSNFAASTMFPAVARASTMRRRSAARPHQGAVSHRARHHDGAPQEARAGATGTVGSHPTPAISAPRSRAFWRTAPPLENNISERDLRREVLNRKNWLVLGSDEGAASTPSSSPSSPVANSTASSPGPTPRPLLPPPGLGRPPHPRPRAGFLEADSQQQSPKLSGMRRGLCFRLAERSGPVAKGAMISLRAFCCKKFTTQRDEFRKSRLS